MGYLKFFFTDWTFFLPCNLPYKLKKIFYPLNYYPLKVQCRYFPTVQYHKLRFRKSVLAAVLGPLAHPSRSTLFPMHPAAHQKA